MSVPATRVLASVLRSKFGIRDDALRLWPASTGPGSPPDGYAIVDVAGELYTVPALLGAVSKDETGEQVSGETAWLLVTQDSITAIGRPDLPEYEPPWPTELPPTEDTGPCACYGPPPVYHLKVSQDVDAPVVGDGAFTFAVPRDMIGAELESVEIDVTTPGTSGITQVQIRNASTGVDLLSTRAQIDAADFHSMDSTVQPVVKPAPARIVAHGTRLAVDVDAVAAGAKGLGVVLHFSGMREPVYHFKVSHDAVALAVGAAQFTFAAPVDLDGFRLNEVEIDVTTPGSAATTVQVRNLTQGVNLLSTLASIDAGEYHSKDATTQPVVAPVSLAHGDRITVDVVATGAGAKGLGVVLYFVPDVVPELP